MFDIWHEIGEAWDEIEIVGYDYTDGKTKAEVIDEYNEAHYFDSNPYNFEGEEPF